MKTLGIDLGSNSIGWALVDPHLPDNQIISCGVYRYQAGVKQEKGKESSLAAERTMYRAARRQKFRRRLRKYHTLKLLIKSGMCPLSYDELFAWCKYRKGEHSAYPISQEFRDWLKTTDQSKEGEGSDRNPYVLRYKAVREKLTPLELGRIFYHIAQRRGFKSNRKAGTESPDGPVSKGIKDLSEEMGGRTLGEYFYELWKQGERVRNRYTSREEHYRHEFDTICDFQQLESGLRSDLEKILFYQRPLRSQKYTVGKCPLEKRKPRAPISHYLFEEYRAWAFINNLKVRPRRDDAAVKIDFAPLDFDQKNALCDFFLSKKDSFTVDSILKKLYDKEKGKYECNYRSETSVPGSPVSSGLKKVFGDNWKDVSINGYTIEKIWHNLFFFDDTEKLRVFAADKLGLDENAADNFCKIPMKQGYASYSLKAIGNILPFLRKGYQLASAVFMAKIPAVVGAGYWQRHSEELEQKVAEIVSTQKATDKIARVANESLRRLWRQPLSNVKDHIETEDIPIIRECFDADYDKESWRLLSDEEKQRQVDAVISLIHSSGRMDKYRGELLVPETSASRLCSYLSDAAGKDSEETGKALYHPAKNEWYSGCIEKDGKKYLGSPELPALKNPLVMRTLHSLKKLLNYLISIGSIDEFTPVHIELANELNDKNKRAAIAWLQREREKENSKYHDDIAGYFRSIGIEQEVSESDIRKCRLWHEQEGKCIYTGKEINFCSLFGPDPKFDFEHTIPRSFLYDNSLENITLCERAFNRNIKKNMMPCDLSNYEDILAFAERCYKQKAEKFIKDANNAANASKHAAEKETKDKCIQKKHFCRMQAEYYLEKYKRFACTEFDPSFTHSQLVDTRIITKYAKSYLKTVFQNVMPIKGSLTKEFRVLWGLQQEYEKKDRTTHVHHAIDAITLACISRQMREKRTQEIKHLRPYGHFSFSKPWETFRQDTLRVAEAIIVAHQHPDKVFTPSSHVKIIHGGKIRSGGDTVRGCLHQETIYGKIHLPSETERDKTVSVVRRSFSDPSFKIDAIVDLAIRKEAEKIGLKKLKEDKVLHMTRKDGSVQQVYKVRCEAKTAKNAIALKMQRDESVFPYKRFQYVVNDTNYAMAIYEGKDKKGKLIRTSVIVNLLDAVSRRKNGRRVCESRIEKNGVALDQIYFLQNGMNVILWEKDPEEARGKTPAELMNRMYFIAKMTGDKIYLQANHRAAAVPEEEVKWGAFTVSDPVFARRGLRCSQFNALVEGVGFRLNPDGAVEYI